MGISVHHRLRASQETTVTRSLRKTTKITRTQKRSGKRSAKQLPVQDRRKHHKTLFRAQRDVFLLVLGGKLLPCEKSLSLMKRSLFLHGLKINPLFSHHKINCNVLRTMIMKVKVTPVIQHPQTNELHLPLSSPWQEAGNNEIGVYFLWAWE